MSSPESQLYVNGAVPPVTVTVMLPFAFPQLGLLWASVSVAAIGAALIVTAKAVDTQPAALRTVRL
ncbi:hypothetical protein D3C79_745980 [compost metagenome]